MSAYQTDYQHHERLRVIIAEFLKQSGPKQWAALAATLLPESPAGAPLEELKLYRAWINYSYATANGHLQRLLGRNHPDLATAQKAVTDRAIIITGPIKTALRAAEDPGFKIPPAAEPAVQAVRAASIAANQPAKDAAQRFPASGARPFHGGSRPQINIPDNEPIPYAWRDRAMRLIGKLFTITREGRKQGILKQSGMTVIRTLMLGFANGKTGACYPSYEAIADRSGLGRSTVAEAIALLSDLGFLEVTNRTKQAPIQGRGGAVIGVRYVQTSNSYRLAFGNFLAIAAASPRAAIDAVAGWLDEWSRFLRDLKDFLLKQSESKTRLETDTDILSERNNYPKPTSRSPFLRRVCRWRSVFDPRTSFKPSPAS